MKTLTKQLVIGLSGLGLSVALFFFSAINIQYEGIYSVLAGFSIISVLFWVGYILTRNVITASVVPLVMFVMSIVVEFAPRLSGTSPAEPSAQAFGSSGGIVFLLAIVAAYFTHQYVNHKKIGSFGSKA